MKVIVLILGVLALAYEGECFAWQTPALTDGGDAGQVANINQGDTGTLYTVGVTSSTAFAIVSQVPAGVLQITFATATGVIAIVSGQTIDYQAATTHVLVITGTFSTTETATLTLVVHPLYFLSPNRCETISGYYAAASVLATQTALGATTKTYASVSATTGYTFDTSNGEIKTTAALTSTTTAVAVTVVATAAEAHGTASTVTTTVVLCINGGCSCSSYGFSGSSALAAGLLSVIMVLVMQLK